MPRQRHRPHKWCISLNFTTTQRGGPHAKHRCFSTCNEQGKRACVRAAIMSQAQTPYRRTDLVLRLKCRSQRKVRVTAGLATAMVGSAKIFSTKVRRPCDACLLGRGRLAQVLSPPPRRTPLEAAKVASCNGREISVDKVAVGISGAIDSGCEQWPADNQQTKRYNIKQKGMTYKHLI